MKWLRSVAHPSLTIVLSLAVFILVGERFKGKAPSARPSVDSAAQLYPGESFQGVQFSGLVPIPPYLGGGNLLVVGPENGKGSLCVYRISGQGSEFQFRRKRFRVQDCCLDMVTFVSLGDDGEQRYAAAR